MSGGDWQRYDRLDHPQIVLQLMNQLNIGFATLFNEEYQNGEIKGVSTLHKVESQAMGIAALETQLCPYITKDFIVRREKQYSDFRRHFEDEDFFEAGLSLQEVYRGLLIIAHANGYTMRRVVNAGQDEALEGKIE